MKILSDRLFRAAWVAFLVLLPFTSLPLVAALLRTDTVAAPAIFPVAGLFVFWLLPKLLRGGSLPRQVVPLLVLLLVFVLASAASFWLEVPPWRGRAPQREMLDAFITLAAAAMVYLVAASYSRQGDGLKRTLFWLNVGGAVMVGWSLVQALFIVAFDGQFPGWMKAIQDVVSMRRLFDDRVTGLAFEPSWLAHQLNMLYLPLWLAAVLNRYSVHRRLGKLMVEDLLFAGALIALLLSFSRVGWAAFGLVATLLLIRATVWLIRKAVAKITVTGRAGRGLRAAAALGLALFFISVYVAGLSGAFVIAGRFDSRIGQISNRLEQGTGSFYQLSNQLAFAERAVLWGAGWEIFGDYPLLGVGLGNAGFFIPDYLPGYGWFLTEINEILFQRNFLPNTKSLWSRLLAESGLLGFTVFVAWLWVLWRTARVLRRREDPLTRTLGWMGAFVLIALILEGFSVDSFGLPYLWFSLGLLTAVSNHDL
jgi:O-antigen ligase